MKSKEEVRKLAEKKYPYNPYDNQFFPEKRTSLISGFIDGFLEAQKQIEDTKPQSENILK